MKVTHSSRWAWEPLTPRGVAAFATATTGRLWLVQVIVAVLAASVMTWCLYDGWLPTVRNAIRQLPSEGSIGSARLDWHGDNPVLLAESRSLAISVDLENSGEIRSPAHFQVEFEAGNFSVRSLFGYLRWPYPEGWAIPFNREELEPWWGAWQPMMLAATFAGTLIFLFFNWTLLATLYFLPAWIIAFFTNRQLTLGGSWRISGAALMPGAFLMMGGMLLYTLGALDQVRFLFFVGAHWVLGWIYLGVTLAFLPRVVERGGPNPFATEKSEKPKNPFADKGSPKT